MQNSFKNIGVKIRSFRHQLLLTESDISTILWCSQQTINFIESGKTHGKWFAAYLLYLRRKGFDINTVFDSEEIESE